MLKLSLSYLPLRHEKEMKSKLLSVQKYLQNIFMGRKFKIDLIN